MSFNVKPLMNKKVYAAVAVLALALLAAFGKDIGPVCNVAQLAGLVDSCL